MKKKYFLEKFKKILPSKKFTVILGIGAMGALFIFLIFFFFGGKESFTSKKSNSALKNKTVADLVQKDTDNDTVPDWEEALWNTDKTKKNTFEGMPDSVYISNKKKDLQQEGEVGDNTANETDKFASEFFSAYMAMKEGQVDSTTINNFSSSLGQKMVDPNLIDKYEEKEVKMDPVDTSDEWAKYYSTIAGIFQKYKDSGIGDELGIASQGLITYDSQGAANIDELLVIGDAYTSFANDVMQTPVPESLVPYHLRIANNANNTGISVGNMTKIIDDPVVGLAGLSQYQKYSQELVTAVSDLKDNL